MSSVPPFSVTVGGPSREQLRKNERALNYSQRPSNHTVSRGRTFLIRDDHKRDTQRLDLSREHRLVQLCIKRHGDIEQAVEEHGEIVRPRLELRLIARLREAENERRARCRRVRALAEGHLREVLAWEWKDWILGWAGVGEDPYVGEVENFVCVREHCV